MSTLDHVRSPASQDHLLPIDRLGFGAMLEEARAMTPTKPGEQLVVGDHVLASLEGASTCGSRLKNEKTRPTRDRVSMCQL